jgi:hypothetical protein
MLPRVSALICVGIPRRMHARVCTLLGVRRDYGSVLTLACP